VKLSHGDRVTLDGRPATVVSPHDKGAVSVLPDDRPRSAGTELWPGDRVVKAKPVRGCPVCRGKHRVFYCPERA
jgi:hypothetical protein